MLIQAFPSGPFQTNAYIVACLETKQAAIIDPGVQSADALISFLEKEGLTPTKIILTHTHWDHVADAALLKEKYGIPVFVHPLEAQYLREPGSDGIPCWMAIPKVEPDEMLEEGQTVAIGNLSFLVIHTPGHSPGGVCLHSADHKTLLSGDTLFKGSIGNLSIPTAHADHMWKSLEKLSLLPAETAVYPGHGPATTIGAEPWLPDAKNIFGSYS